MKPTLYLETTIVSYLTARPSRDVVILGHQAATRQWWEEERGRYQLLVSPFVTEEAARGDPGAARKRLTALEGIESLEVTSELEALAEDIRANLNIPEKARLDAVHMACTVLYDVDYLLTWNCAHLANGENLRLLAQFTRSENLWLPVVLTPDEMIKQKELEIE